MTSKSMWVLVVVVVLVIAGAVFFLNRQSATAPGSSPAESAPLAPAPAATSPSPAPAPAAPASPAAASVSMQGFQFSPASLSVKRGTVVTWTNKDSAPHTVTADGGSGPMSGTLSQGATYSYTFNTVGTFNYHCSIHPSMHGTVTVTQ